MSRTIVVGDVHGCADELEDLLDLVALGDSDHLIFVGDLVVRGPKPNRVLQIIRRHGARAVQGNHEHRLLRWKGVQEEKARRSNVGREDFHAGLTSIDRRVMKSKTLRRTAEAIDENGWALIESLPLWIDAHQGVLRIVHGGVIPGISIEHQAERTLLYLRNLDHGQPSERREVGEPWGRFYEGPPHVCFGHNAATKPQLHPWATGLDTGCVYGGQLTAMVLEEGQGPPSPKERRDVLVAVEARATYHPID
jgi:hypothetical protein